MKLFFIFLLISINLSHINAQDVKTVPYVDLNRYAGKWYEIASYPNFFQKGCTCTTAEYTLTNKDYMLVENRCNKGSKNGKESYKKAKAYVDDNSGNAKLNIQFIWPITGKYWIIDLADDYSYAVVSHPKKKYLWILSRTPSMNDITYGLIKSRLIEKGFDLGDLQKTIQDIK